MFPPSNGEPRPPLRSTRIDDRASGFGFHSHAKTMSAFAPRLRGLVGSFHDACFDGPKNP
jgi:hypothetical protein